jgi:hypothetical protein
MTVIAVEGEGDQLTLAPYRHAYDPATKRIFLAAANFQAYASTIKGFTLSYDPEKKAVVDWRYNKGLGPTVAWTFEAPEAGDYELSLEYAVESHSAGVPIEVLIDHKRQLSFTTEATGGEKGCERKVIGTVKLEKGRQELALQPVKSEANKLFVLQQLRGVTLTKK